jgi:hypothetical protein
MKEPRPVIVKTLVVDKKPDIVFDFFSNPKNWERGGVLKETKKIDGDWWQADTPLGEAKIRIRANKALGTFDHDFVIGRREWTVFCRVTPNERGSTVSWLFTRPERMSQSEFERQLGDSFDKEMEGYKKAILAL